MCFGDQYILESIARNVHIVMLVICLGIAALADLTAAKSISRPLSDRSLAKLNTYHRALTTGLIILWISGLMIIWLKTSFDVAQFSPKLMAKIFVVSILSVNAIVIGWLALGTFKEHREMRFGELRFGLRLALAVSAGLSTASWISAFCLGAIPELRTASPDLLLEVLGHIYGAGILGGLFVATFSGAANSPQNVVSPAEHLVASAITRSAWQRPVSVAL